MKTFLILLSTLLLLVQCRKDVAACRDYQQAEPKPLIDANTLYTPEFKAILTQYPYLKAYEFNDQSHSTIMKCYVYYKDLPVITDHYLVYKDKTSNTLTLSDTLKTYALPVSVVPGISNSDAIKEAKKIMNFDHTCIFYSLGIYNTGLYGPYDPNKYMLVWKIEGSKGYPLVIVDANTRQIYQSTDGIIVN